MKRLLDFGRSGSTAAREAVSFASAFSFTAVEVAETTERIEATQPVPARALNVNGKGSVGEAVVLTELTKLGYFVYKPFSDHAPVDLIVADADMRLIRLQVKYRKVEFGRIVLPLHSVVNGRKVPVNLGWLDGWAIYNPEHDAVLYLHKGDLRSGAFSVRVVEPKRRNKLALSVEDLSKYRDPRRLFELGYTERWVSG